MEVNTKLSGSGNTSDTDSEVETGTLFFQEKNKSNSKIIIRSNVTLPPSQFSLPKKYVKISNKKIPVRKALPSSKDVLSKTSTFVPKTLSMSTSFATRINDDFIEKTNNLNQLPLASENSLFSLQLEHYEMAEDGESSTGNVMSDPVIPKNSFFHTMKQPYTVQKLSRPLHTATAISSGSVESRSSSLLQEHLTDVNLSNGLNHVEAPIQFLPRHPPPSTVEVAVSATNAKAIPLVHQELAYLKRQNSEILTVLQKGFGKLNKSNEKTIRYIKEILPCHSVEAFDLLDNELTSDSDFYATMKRYMRGFRGIPGNTNYYGSVLTRIIDDATLYKFNYGGVKNKLKLDGYAIIDLLYDVYKETDRLEFEKKLKATIRFAKNRYNNAKSKTKRMNQ